MLSPTLAADGENTAAALLLLHGADDPYVPQDHVEEWISVMSATDVDWQLVQFANTVHSFTDPAASTPGKAEFNQRSSDRAFAYMDEFFDEELN